MAASSPSTEPLDGYLQVQGIKGETTDDAHKDWIEVLSLEWGDEQRAESPGEQAGPATVQFRDFIFTKVVDTASSSLYSACATGKTVKRVTLELCAASGEREPYARIVLIDVAVVAVALAGVVGEGATTRPTERVSLRYGKISWKYFKTTQDGKKGPSWAGGWNLGANMPCYVE